MPQHGAVRGVVKLLQQLRDQNRKRKGQQRFPNRAFVYVNGFLHLSTSFDFIISLRIQTGYSGNFMQRYNKLLFLACGKGREVLL